MWRFFPVSPDMQKTNLNMTKNKQTKKDFSDVVTMPE